MNIRHPEIEIEQQNPFSNCKLGRQKYSVVLTNIINSYPFGFVLALNNKWGTGKTTFVKMWEQDLKNNNFQTLYFNAWENDFENNPLIKNHY
jgi:predicted AAA+ superfamily ATPase